MTKHFFFFQGKQRMANVLFFQAKTARGQIFQFFQGRQKKWKILKFHKVWQSMENEPVGLESRVIHQISAFFMLY